MKDDDHFLPYSQTLSLLLVVVVVLSNDEDEDVEDVWVARFVHVPKRPLLPEIAIAQRYLQATEVVRMNCYSCGCDCCLVWIGATIDVHTGR